MTARRERTVDSPNACRWCARNKFAHGLYYARSVGNHYFTEPTDAQRLARMTARREANG
jgi:hypothetical protein